MSLTTTIPLKLGTTQVSRFVSGEGVGLAWGGTGQDLSASGGATFVLAQDASHVISARALIAADIPSLDAAKITTGTIPLARGGTNADLSATGGTSKFLRQASAGAAITVVQPTLADLAAGTLGVDLQLGAVGIKFAGAGTASATTSQIYGYAANSHIIYNTPSTYSHSFRTANVDMFVLGYSPLTGYADNAFGLGQYGCGGGNSYAGIYSNGTQYLVHNATVSHQWKISGTSYALQNSSGFETNRICLGQTIGTPIDPGAGGLLLSGLIRYYSGYGSSIADSTLVQTYTDGYNLLHNVNSGAYHGLRIGGYNTYTFGYSPTLASAGTNVFQLGEGSAGYILSDGWGITYNAANTYAHTLKVAGTEKFKVTSADCIAAGNFKFSTSSSLIKGTTGLYILGEGGSGGTATSGFVALGGGHSYSSTHGALLAVYGITAGGTGSIHLVCGAVAGASHVFYDKNSAQQLKIDESGSEFKQDVAGGTSGLLVYSNRTSDAVALYLGGGSQTTGFINSGGALIQLQGSGNVGHALYYCATTVGASHYFYDKTATAQARIYEGGLLVYGGFGMAGIGPVGRQTLSAASTDLATVITLANSIRTALIAFGLGV